MQFEHEADYDYFKSLLAQDSDANFEPYLCLFDNRPLIIKRKEFNSKKRKYYEALKLLFGERCFLRYKTCDLSSGFCIDHLIPLSTNQLNKEIRNLKPAPGKKVQSQSLGSNNPNNLIIACNKCNAHKKHKLLTREIIARIFKETKRFQFEM
jgi:5-methylcytosine-specific restriction endonuclease McrA